MTRPSDGVGGGGEVEAEIGGGGGRGGNGGRGERNKLLSFPLHSPTLHPLPFPLTPVRRTAHIASYPYIRSKFQVSILINQKMGPLAPRKGRFMALMSADPHICISLCFILYEQYAYQISIFYLDK